jgi:hypothetical protein
MKIVKKILIGIAILVVLVLIVALFVGKEYTVVSEIIINKPKHEVFDYVKHIKNQNNYSKWNMMDPNSKMEYTGTDGTVGFVSSWDSENKNVGKGEQEIKKIVEGERLDMELRFKRPFESTSTAYMATDSIAPNQTKVTWGFAGSMPYPFNIMRLCMSMEKMLGDDLMVGLTNLKGILEKQ